MISKIARHTLKDAVYQDVSTARNVGGNYTACCKIDKKVELIWPWFPPGVIPFWDFSHILRNLSNCFTNSFLDHAHLPFLSSLFSMRFKAG